MTKDGAINLLSNTGFTEKGCNVIILKTEKTYISSFYIYYFDEAKHMSFSMKDD